ncbi:hypothetical protein QBC47DRAFT_393990 [Echria macrotheca]|uniref:2EXR domain-containing protein n=1 Tax=Echria macrotheca TaxID=438768 RepID=A0AAJ0B2B7_9PEZI|nr:hypothetical protein QBC47DRAFT_393990 [Echria macrotheca]
MSSQENIETFHFFPRLPAELRQQIWQEACDVERIIPILPGLGHLSPITHRSLAAPPLLHACAESRAIGLRNYDLAFHPQLYTNRNRDRDMILYHIFSPHQKIDDSLYFCGRPRKFQWSQAPHRVAVFLDDCGWNLEPLTRYDMPPVSYDNSFLRSLSWLTETLRELVVLVLPPLTARPNPVAHRIELVPGVPRLQNVDGFDSQSLTRRTRSNEFLGTGHHEIEATVSVRFATCTPWPEEEIPVNGTMLTAPKVASRTKKNIRSGAYKNTRKLHDQVKRSQLKDVKELRSFFNEDVGLGPHFYWRPKRWGCGTGRIAQPYQWEANPVSLWADEVQSEEEDDGKLPPMWDRWKVRVFKRNGIPYPDDPTPGFLVR